MIEARMDGTVEERLMWRIMALREALLEISDAGMHECAKDIARNALKVDEANHKISISARSGEELT